MTPTILLLAYLALVFITAATARAADPPKGSVIDSYIRQAQTCQRTLHQPPFPRRISPWALKGHNPRKVLALWQQRLARCREVRRQWNYRAWMPQHWINLAICEEHLNWRHNDGVYEGAFAFYYGSWDEYKLPGYPDSASEATPWEQWQVALRIARKLTIAIPWGCWRGADHAWVRAGLPERGVRS